MIAIIAAMDLERDALKQHLEDSKHLTISGIEFDQGHIGNQEVVLMLSGVGKGYAALSTTILLEHFPISQIINIGTAGGIRPEEQILDIVVSTKVVQHDFDTSAIDGTAGIGLHFEADQTLIDSFEKAMSTLDCHVFTGQIASGDRFVVSGPKMDEITTTFPEALCCEMEAGAIAQVAAHYQKPFVIIRSLSDVACYPDSHMDFPVYAKKASERSALFVSEVIRNL